MYIYIYKYIYCIYIHIYKKVGVPLTLPLPSAGSCKLPLALSQTNSDGLPYGNSMAKPQGQDCQDRSAKRGRPGKYSMKGQLGQDQQPRKKGQPGQACQDGAARTGKRSLDSQDRTPQRRTAKTE